MSTKEVINFTLKEINDEVQDLIKTGNTDKIMNLASYLANFQDNLFQLKEISND